MLNKHPFNKAYLVTVFMVFSMDRILVPPDRLHRLMDLRRSNVDLDSALFYIYL